jgi:predicted nucleotidyltransferase
LCQTNNDNVDGSAIMPANVPLPDSPVLAEIVRRLVDLYRPERIYLFGSAARGDAGPDSDYDFMVVVRDGTPRELSETKTVFKALQDIDAPIDVLMWTRQELDKRLHLRVSFPSTIVKEGKLLYAAWPGPGFRHQGLVPKGGHRPS